MDNDYLSTPEVDGKYPGLILIHEIWGLTDHIKNVADRLRDEGFVVLAPDLFFGTDVAKNITPEITGDQQKMREATAPARSPEFAKAALAHLHQDFKALKDNPAVNGKIGVIGFCFGGSYAYAFAGDEPGLRAAVPFYGSPLDKEKVKNIKCPILAFYGEKDAPLMESLPSLREEMAKQNKDFEVVVYPEAGHAFFNDTNEARYNKEAAKDAWPKLLKFLKKNLA